MKIASISLGGDFQTITFDNGSEVYGSSEQDQYGAWIDSRAITWLIDHMEWVRNDLLQRADA